MNNQRHRWLWLIKIVINISFSRPASPSSRWDDKDNMKRILPIRSMLNISAWRFQLFDSLEQQCNPDSTSLASSPSERIFFYHLQKRQMSQRIGINPSRFAETSIVRWLFVILILIESIPQLHRSRRSVAWKTRENPEGMSDVCSKEFAMTVRLHSFVNWFLHRYYFWLRLITIHLAILFVTGTRCCILF